MDIDDFTDEFTNKYQWHEMQEGEKCCLQCNNFRPWLRKKAVCEMILSFWEEYKKGKMGECVEAGKLAEKQLNDVRCRPILAQTNGHCLLYKNMGVVNVAKRAFFDKFFGSCISSCDGIV